MTGQNIFSRWFAWHFYKAPAFLLSVWMNYISFALDYFSMPALLKSFFSPWRRYRWKYPRITQLGEFFETLISNTFSRLIGAALRLILIIIGILFQIFILLAGAVIFLFWVLCPFIAIILIWFSI